MKKNFRPTLILLTIFLLSARGQSDLAINPNFVFNGEQSLAMNPNNPSHLAVAWMKFHAFPSPTSIVIAVSQSTNAGLNWTPPVEIPHFRPHWTSADPTLAFKNDGSLYLGYIDYKMNKDSGAVFLRKSTDGGTSWGSASKVIDKHDNSELAIDRPWIAIDNSAGTYSGNIYVVTKSIAEDTPPHRIFMMRSNNDGASWSAPLLVDNSIPCGPNLKSMGVPAVTKAGKLLIAYVFYNPPSLPGFACAVSSDGGASLSNSVIVTQTSGVVTNDTLLQASYNLSADPTNSNNLMLVTTRKSNTDFDIYRVYSNNGGLSWTGMQRLGSDAAGNGNNQDMVWAAYSSSGKYAAVWRDRRANNGAQNQPYKIWGAYSADGGNNFNSDFQLSQTDGPLLVPVDGNDFLGCALNDTVVYATWTDKRGSNNQLFINKYKMGGPASLNVTKPDADLIFPNPNHGSFTIQFANVSKRKVEIVDMTGRKVFETSYHGRTLEIRLKEQAGNYIVRIDEDGKLRTINMLLQ